MFCAPCAGSAEIFPFFFSDYLSALVFHFVDTFCLNKIYRHFSAFAIPFVFLLLLYKLIINTFCVSLLFFFHSCSLLRQTNKIKTFFSPFMVFKLVALIPLKFIINLFSMWSVQCTPLSFLLSSILFFSPSFFSPSTFLYGFRFIQSFNWLAFSAFSLYTSKIIFVHTRTRQLSSNSDNDEHKKKSTKYLLCAKRYLNSLRSLRLFEFEYMLSIHIECAIVLFLL